MDNEELQPDIGKDFLVYTKKEICIACGGLCCKTSAGVYAPEDFKMKKITTPFVLHLLMTKRFTISSIGESEQSQYFLRPRHIDEEPVNPNIFGGVCVNWKSGIGCGLKQSDMPYQCRALIPLYDGTYCKHKPSDKSSHTDMANRWSDYQKELITARLTYNSISNKVSYLYSIGVDSIVDIYDGVSEKMDKIEEALKTINP